MAPVRAPHLFWSMDEALREFLRGVGVEMHENILVEKLGVTRLAHLDGLEPTDLDELGLAKRWGPR